MTTPARVPCLCRGGGVADALASAIVEAEFALHTEGNVRLFRNGGNQAVRTPRDLELQGNEAQIRKEGDALMIVSKAQRSLPGTLKSLKPLREAFRRSRAGWRNRSIGRCPSERSPRVEPCETRLPATS